MPFQVFERKARRGLGTSINANEIKKGQGYGIADRNLFIVPVVVSQVESFALARSVFQSKYAYLSPVSSRLRS